jgi:hypothetical protein
MLLWFTPRSTSGPELADRRSRLIRTIHATCVFVPDNTATGIRSINAALDRNLYMECSGRTMYESSKMSKVGIPIDRMSSGS